MFASFSSNSTSLDSLTSLLSVPTTKGGEWLPGTWIRRCLENTSIMYHHAIAVTPDYIIEATIAPSTGNQVGNDCNDDELEACIQSLLLRRQVPEAVIDAMYDPTKNKNTQINFQRLIKKNDSQIKQFFNQELGVLRLKSKQIGQIIEALRKLKVIENIKN